MKKNKVSFKEEVSDYKLLAFLVFASAMPLIK